MSAPYSDDLYSGDLSDDDNDAFSPVDGYFHASSGPGPSPSQSQSHSHSHSQPSVPNVLVEDPTLREQGAAKAREAEEERLNNTDNPQSPQAQSHSHSPGPTVHTPSSAQTPSQPQYQHPASHTSPTSPTHHHRRSVEEDQPIHFAGHTRPAASLPFARDAPPAYSPASPQSGHPSAGYQTFAPVQSPPPTAMGVPDEQQRLLHREPESMGGPPGGNDMTMWKRIKQSCNMPSLRRKLRTLLGVLVILSIFLMLFSSFTLRPSHDHKVCSQNFGSCISLTLSGP